MQLLTAPAAKGVTHAFRVRAEMQLLTAPAAQGVTHAFRAYRQKCSF